LADRSEKWGVNRSPAVYQKADLLSMYKIAAIASPILEFHSNALSHYNNRLSIDPHRPWIVDALSSLVSILAFSVPKIRIGLLPLFIAKVLHLVCATINNSE